MTDTNKTKTRLEEIYTRYDILMKEFKEDCIFHKENMETQFNVTMLSSKWITYTSEWNMLYRALEQKRKEIYRKLYQYYRLESPLKISTKAELDLFIESDPQYTTIYQECQVIKEVIEFCKTGVEHMRNKAFEITRFIDWQKFINGKL